MLPLSLYVHIPWCIKKCPYCDFNSHAVKSDLPEIHYINAVLQDLAVTVTQYAISTPISSIFIGGGTPSLFSPEAINRLLQGIVQYLPVMEDLEITLEANPGTFESSKFTEFRALGINRLSIGVQSFTDTLLANLGRVHSAQEAIKAAEIAHQAGFNNFNIDLMYGLPGATVDSSVKDITTAINLEPTHLSFYQMTLEPNTYFYRFPPKLPDDTLIYDMQKRCQKILLDCGYQQYEVSAYSRVGYECRHNVNYWQFGDYLGIGAGAHGKVTQALPNQIVRTMKPKSPEQYMTHDFDSNAAKAIAIAELPLEFMMNALRLRRGFAVDDYHLATGLAFAVVEPILSQCVQENLLIKQDNRYYCSEKGWNFLDSILEKFVP